MCCRSVTLKTVFLLALATARRVSEIHALQRTQLEISADRAVIRVAEGFLAKNQKQGDSSLIININANNSNGALCPVKSLRKYLDLTDQLRPDRSQLFISMVAPHKDVSINTISRWLAAAIRESYKKIDRSLLPHINAHEIRAISASMFIRGNSPEEILSTGLWRSKFCFLEHYFRKVDYDLSDCGPIMVLNKLTQ